MWSDIKRFFIATFTVIFFVLYFISTDPDTKIFQNLPYGSTLILTLGIFVIASVGLWIVEVFYDWFLDPVYGKEKKLVEIAKQDPKASGLTLIAKSIRILAAAIMVAASIIAYNIS